MTKWLTKYLTIQNELVELKDILAKQLLFTQKLKEDNLSDSAKIINLEKKVQDMTAIVQASLLDNYLAGNPDTKSAGKDQPVHLLDPLLNQIMSGELFKDPQFAKVFQEQVAEVVKNIQQKQREEQIEKFNEQLRQRLGKRIEDLAKSLNLNDYQQQEFSKILSERGNKTIELFSKFRVQELSAEEFRDKRETLRNEANEKVKQILLPQQYDQYKKVEPSFNRRLSQGGEEMPR
jgi:hypothetical protein